MKITLDIPDETKGMFVNYVYRDKCGLQMAALGMESDDLFDGAEILVRPGKKREQQ